MGDTRRPVPTWGGERVQSAFTPGRVGRDHLLASGRQRRGTYRSFPSRSAMRLPSRRSGGHTASHLFSTLISSSRRPSLRTMMAACSVENGAASRPSHRPLGTLDGGKAQRQSLLELPFALELLDGFNKFEEVHAVDHAGLDHDGARSTVG